MILLYFFFKSKNKKFWGFFCEQWKKKAFKCTCAMAHTVQLLLKARCILSYYTVLLVLKSGQLMANQMWEFCYSYDSGKNRKALVYYSCVNKCLWQSREGRTCKHACVLGLVKWKGRRVFNEMIDWGTVCGKFLVITKTCGPIYKS